MFASLAAGLFAVVLASRGFCAMGAAAEGPTDPHGCCRTGLRPVAPACCLDAPSTDTHARPAPAPATIAAASAAFVPCAEASADLLAAAGPAATTPAHPPPRTPSVLRI